jgi:hypothetical protein
MMAVQAFLSLLFMFIVIITPSGDESPAVYLSRESSLFLFWQWGCLLVVYGVSVVHKVE